MKIKMVTFFFVALVQPASTCSKSRMNTPE